MFEGLFSNDKKVEGGQQAQQTQTATQGRPSMFEGLFDKPAEQPKQLNPATREVFQKQGFKAASQFDQKRVQNATITQAPEKVWPLGFVGRAAKKGYEAARDTFSDTVDRIGDFVDTLDSSGVPLSYTKLPEPGMTRKEMYLKEGGKLVTPAERIGKAVRMGVGAANIVFTPITAGFEAAKEIPIVKYPAKAVGWAFEKVGKVGEFVGSKAVDVLPVSEDAKNQLRQPISEMTALLAQVAAGKAGAKGLGEVKAKLITKVAERKAAGVEVDAGEAKKITSEITKEVKVDSPGYVRVDGPTERVTVRTNQRLVLENMIKGQEDITYKRVKSLGRDYEGNPVAARFEWDYKNREATIYATNKTTAANLAHELGHYFDRKIAQPLNERFSDLVRDYQKNKAQVNSALAEYAVESLDGNATAKEVTAYIKKTVDGVHRGIEVLTPDETRGTYSELFATAVRTALLEPERAAKAAPEFKQFVDYFQNKTGVVADMIKDVTRPKTGTLYRGTAGEKGLPAGDRVPSQFAEGEYYTTNRGYAESYGPKIAEGEAPKNPKVIDYKDLVKNKQEFYQRGLREAFGTSNPAEITAKLQAEGYDALVVKDVPNQRMAQPEYGLKEFAGKADEVIVFKKPAGGETTSLATVTADMKIKPLDMIKKKFEATGSAIIAQREGARLVLKDEGDFVKLGMDTGRLTSTDVKLPEKTFATKEEAYRFIGDMVAKKKLMPKNEVIETKALPEGKTPQGEKPPAGGAEGAKQGVVEGMFAGTGKKTGEFVKGRPAFNPDKINAPEDVQQLIQGVSRGSKEFEKQRVSKTDDNLKALAQEVGVTPEDLMKLKPGSIANAETVLKSRQIVADLAMDLRDTIREVTTETATKEQLNAVKTKLLRLQGAMKAVAGMRTEASNVFRQFKIESTPGEFDIMRDLVSALKKVDGKAGDDLSAFVKGSKELVEPTIVDKAWHLWYMSILSGGSTQIKNISGNLTQMLGEVAVEAVTNPKGFRGSMTGLWEGLVKGGSEAWKILREGDLSKFEERGIKPIKFTLGKEKATGFSKGVRTAGAAILNSADYVGRFMSAMDVWARTGFKGMEIRGQAREIAARVEGLKGDALEQRINELTSKPTEEMIIEADKFGQHGTYTQKPSGTIGILSEFMGKGARKIPGGKLILPFTRIVANVVNNSLDWTPVGFKRALIRPMKIGGREVFKEGGFMGKYYDEGLKPRARKQELGRAVLGTVAMTYAASLAADGLLSGNGPSDYKKKEQLMNTGWRPNSIKIGDKWYPYQNWGPMAIPLTLVGNYFDYQKWEADGDQGAAGRLTAGVLNSVNSILDMSFLSGTADLVTALQNLGKGGEKYFVRFAAQQATSVVPNLVKQTARYFDPNAYTADGIKEQVLLNLRVTTGLKPKLNVFGEQVKGEALTALQPVAEVKDETLKYLAKNDLWVTVPSKATKVHVRTDPATFKEGRPMTEDEYYNFVKYSGIEIKKRLSMYLEKIKSFPADKRQDYVNEITQEVRDQVKSGIEMGVYK